MRVRFKVRFRFGVRVRFGMRVRFVVDLGLGCWTIDNWGGNLLQPLHGLLFPISSKGSFIYPIPHTGWHIQWTLLHQLWSTSRNEK